MDFEFTHDQLELRDNVRSVLAASCSPAFVRAIFDDEATGAGLWKQMADLYWPAVGIGEDHGGLGLGFVEIGILAEELGRAVAPGPLLATLTQFAPVVQELGDPAQQTRFLEAVASGSISGALALAESDSSWDVTSVQATARPTGDAWVLEGTKRHVFDVSTANEIAVVARLADDDAGLGVFVVPRAELSCTARPLLDRTLDVGTVELAGVQVPGDRALGSPGDPAVRRAVERVAQEATVAMALSTIGTCRAIFEMTLQYAKDRVQYGRPIGSFQALKHRFADWFLAVERATSLGYYAAMTIAEDDDRRTIATAMAKAAAGDCQRLSVQEGLQLHGGIGLTWEHDLHFFLKRAKAGDGLWGTAAHHRAHVADLLGLGPSDPTAMIRASA